MERREACRLRSLLLIIASAVIVSLIGAGIFSAGEMIRQGKEILNIKELVQTCTELILNNMISLVLIIMAYIILLHNHFIVKKPWSKDGFVEAEHSNGNSEAKCLIIEPSRTKFSNFIKSEYRNFNTTEIIESHTRVKEVFSGTVSLSGGYINIGNIFLKRGIVAIEDKEEVDLEIEYNPVDVISTTDGINDYTYIEKFKVIK